MTTSTRTFREKLNSRKLLIAASFELLATLLLVTGFIGPDNWVTVTITIGGAYMATQAYEDKK